MLNYNDTVKIAPFAKALIKNFGYQFQIPSRQIAKTLGKISYVTVRKYLSILENNDYLTCERPSRREGIVYKLKKGRVNRLFDDYRAFIDMDEQFFKVGCDE